VVKGLEKFKEYFENFSDQYVLIGGTACFLSMEEAGLEFRATKDLDVILVIEALDSLFVSAFWKFIRSGGYTHKQKSTGKELFYRFHSPSDQNYPYMIELFSRKPKEVSLGLIGHLTPIPTKDEVSSLSAILLDEDYYHFIHNGKQILNGLPVVKPEFLILLKIRAWIDLSNRLASGESIDSKSVRKHKNDVFRLYQLLSLRDSFVLPPSIEKDMETFLSSMETSEYIDLAPLGIRNTTSREVIKNLREIYGLSHGSFK